MSIFPADQRRELPDEPGVYLFRDARGKVIYVGKAKSIRKRVASHSPIRAPGRAARFWAMIDQIEALVVHTESEALLVEQNFIKQYKPRLNIRLRDDKSYPYIAISFDEDFPRVYFTRERHRRDRAYFGPYSNAKRVRATLEVLGKVFMFRSCDGPEPGRRRARRAWTTTSSAVARPCVGYVVQGGVPKGDRRGNRLHVGPLQGDRAARSSTRCGWRRPNSDSRTRLGSATVSRRSVRCSSASGSPTTGPAGSTRSPWPCRDTEANAQVFQVRDGVLSDRQSFYLDNAADAAGWPRSPRR